MTFQGSLAMAKKESSSTALDTSSTKPSPLPQKHDGVQYSLGDAVTTQYPHRRHGEHTHTHHGTRVAVNSPKKQPSDVSGQVLKQMNSAMDNFGLKVKPAASDGSVRGSDRIIRRVRSKGSESDASSNTERAAAAVGNVERLLREYRQGHNVSGLAEVARSQGIPGSLRREVWPILLSHHPCVRDKHIARECRDGAEASEAPPSAPLNRIRRELERYHRRVRGTPSTRHGSPPSNPSPTVFPPPEAVVLDSDPTVLDQATLDTAVERAIVSFLDRHEHVSYASGMVYVCLSLADWLFTPPSATSTAGVSDIEVADTISTCFEQMMYVMLWSPEKCSTPLEPSDSVITQRISHFLTAFRQLMPELAGYFDEEEVVSFGEEWLFTWIQWWCARELAAPEKGRLWDWYLGFEHPEQVAGGPRLGNERVDANGMISSAASSDETYYPSDWHILVCIALLKCCKDALEELEQSEIRTLLSRLPTIDMALIIDEAKLLRRELRSILVREEEDFANRSNGRRKPK